MGGAKPLASGVSVHAFKGFRVQYLGVILGLYRGYIGIMEKKMETTIVFRGYIGVILGLYWDNGKENGNYYSI